jgi:3-hydroxy-D-aspartate aldolase
MTTRPPAEVGMPLDAVDTPALLLDLEGLERNIARLAGDVSGFGAGVRLRRICCQKVSEAEVMAQAGVPDVLVTNQVVGAPKIARLVRLATRVRLAVCADDAGNVAALDEAATAYGMRLPVLVEVNVGADRCGVEPGEPALALAKRVAAARGLRFAGLQAYHGAAQHIRDYAKREQAIDVAAEKTRRTVELLHRNGLACDMVSGAGTGTYRFEAKSGIWNELQAGSYVFMDVDYLKNLASDGTPVGDFTPSLFVYASVMSRPARDRAVLDAGLKALSVDSGMPRVVGMQDVEYVRASDEHGKLRLHDPTRALPLGSKVRLIPGHCDPTVNLYDWYVGYRSDRVEAIWPVAARGAVL